jgi:DNA end-binding protein Ku
MAPRSTWTGTVGFGLVSFPAATCKAVDELDLRFNTFHVVGDEFHPIGRKEIDKVTGAEVARADVTRAYVVDGEPVPITDAELDALAPEASKNIEIELFADANDVPTIHYTKHEYLMAGKGGEKAFATLRAAMLDTGTVGLAHTVRRGKEHAIAIRPIDDGAMLVSYLATADEVRPARETAPSVRADEKLVGVAGMLIGKMRGSFSADFATDHQRARTLAMIEAKAAGTYTAPDVTPVAPVSEVLDMLSLLEASLA